MIKRLPKYIILGPIGIITIYLGFSGKSLLFIQDTRSAVITLTVVGIFMCASETARIFISRAPAHPLAIAAYLLGISALFIGIVQIFNLQIKYFGNARFALL